VEASFNAPGHEKKRLHMQSARMVAPGHLKHAWSSLPHVLSTQRIEKGKEAGQVSEERGEEREEKVEHRGG
jgi:hypothetical protein